MQADFERVGCEKKISKKSKKVLDKRDTARYNKQAVTEKGAAMYLEN